MLLAVHAGPSSMGLLFFCRVSAPKKHHKHTSDVAVKQKLIAAVLNPYTPLAAHKGGLSDRLLLPTASQTILLLHQLLIRDISLQR